MILRSLRIVDLLLYNSLSDCLISVFVHLFMIYHFAYLSGRFQTKQLWSGCISCCTKIYCWSMYSCINLIIYSMSIYLFIYLFIYLLGLRRSGTGEIVLCSVCCSVLQCFAMCSYIRSREAACNVLQCVWSDCVLLLLWVLWHFTT